jgi:hypothetical protein
VSLRWRRRSSPEEMAEGWVFTGVGETGESYAGGLVGKKKKKKEKGRRERAAWEEGKTREQGRGKRQAGKGGELPRKRMGGKEVGEEKWGEKEEKGRACRPAGGHASPPIPNMPCTNTSPFGDVWHCATSPNGEIKKKIKCMSCMHIYIHTHVMYAWVAACILIYFEFFNYESLQTDYNQQNH